MRGRVARDDRQVRVRPAELSDAPGVAEVHARSWQAAYAGLLPQSLLDDLDPARRAPGWEATLRAVDGPDQATLVAEDDGQLVGFVHLCPARNTSDHSVAEITTMYVAPRSWRTGVGRRLMAAALDQLADAGSPRRCSGFCPPTNERSASTKRPAG